MAEKKKNEELIYDGSVKQDKKGNPILGTLEGPCADFLLPTRNGRLYSEELWENVFKNPMIQELFECGGILGELDHPTDRDDTCTEKVAICMPEPPKKNSDGKLIAKFHILDTPNGRIAKTLCDYGYKMGISSRGSGDVTEDYKGNEVVDPDTYDFKAFDLVILPAVKSARLKMVESLQNNKTLKQALCESLDAADEDARKIMTETLNRLKIDYQEEPKVEKTVDDVKVGLMKELQEAVKARQSLEAENRQLQEKLSVCYAKETKFDEQLKKYESVVVDLSANARRVKPLQNKVDMLEGVVKDKEELINKQNARIQKLSENIKLANSNKTTLNEDLNTHKQLIEGLKAEKQKLIEQVELEKDAFAKKEKVLQESIEEMRKNSMLKNNEYNEKLKKANELVEHYRAVASAAVDKYISSKAKTLGVSVQEIKNRLNENYTFKDVDLVCNDIQSYQLNISRLPVDVRTSKMSITESKETIANMNPNSDDDIDEGLLKLAKIK